MKRWSFTIIGITTLLAISACNSTDNNYKNTGSEPVAVTKSAATNPQVAGDEFLAKNKTATGVKTTASGLQYKINHAGSGKKPQATDMVTVQYEGRLIDGTVFDSTAQRNNKPATFPLNGVIPGWTEGLQLMSEGSDFTFYIPANLAYGDQSPTSAIPANSVLIFDVKLIKVGM
ncbi:MAG: FKBP-type peptidyl-prolyl cis-trans isomerase [Snodgrassella sp.]|uniref:FKBP-type peptidyl-prolyl cis-trans isomerase n=1 Tax=Snodgrassella TaxID=1193515 RepID=UPI000815AE4D|nr:FKBP-type peptidyl-prolyl cis-trans isomerase [Snodgrassella sp.]MCO6514426.1 FKBP-type peptidyl-prolyl cis-trans isomerase [Snodgrassella sp.]MCO6516294.1 FKBP-type peptidyl-prolyl cis-trans isomerase [Snodgrassella sp.]MCO6525455.1 FKBP-type peptidyl-prolyl cis-trans isomerase [Snodgrassella sp.]SCB75151.1 FKBP-type peptidyl-prolyl cis-trans isomerase FkpA [Snodgrassella sp. R-53583]